jgi:hypothetical protein
MTVQREPDDQLEELKSAFKAADILLVEVEGEGLNESRVSAAFHVTGSLEQYIQAAQALQNRVVFVYAQTLDKEDFLYGSEDPDGESGDRDEDQDLCDIEPELKLFRARIGSVGSFHFYAPVPEKGLCYVVEHEWYTRFYEHRDSAIDGLEERAAESQAHRDQEESTRLRELERQLDGLVHDKKFARLPTQKAMLAYAKMNIAGIEELDQDSLKVAISNLAAKILANS